jgi:hypothetical protein
MDDEIDLDEKDLVDDLMCNECLDNVVIDFVKAVPGVVAVRESDWDWQWDCTLATARQHADEKSL